MQFAAIGWFFRYEAYLMALGVFVVGTAAIENWRGSSLAEMAKRLSGRYIAAGLALFLVVAPPVARALPALAEVPQAMRNIYGQQYQMGLFLREYYEGVSVAAHDIGAINYFADIRCLDLGGLATVELDSVPIEALVASKAVQVAVVYESLCPEGLCGRGVKAGEWEIRDNLICGDDTVAFYAIGSSEEGVLKRNLRRFAPKLPSSVAQTGAYMQ